MTAPLTGTLAATPFILQPVEVLPGRTVTRADAVIEAVRAGNSYRTAAAWAHTTSPTVTGWLTRGRQLLETATQNAETNETTENPLASIPDPDRVYAQFALDAARAEAIVEMRLTGVMHKAATDGDWRAAQVVLTARERGSWAPPSRVEVSGPGGGAVSHSVAVLDDRGVDRLMGELAERRVVALGAVDVDEVAVG